MQKNISFHSSFKNKLLTCVEVLKNEIIHNYFSFLLPLPVFLGIIIFLALSHQSKLVLGINGTWVFLTLGILLAMVYGLQCFSGESDRNTLDFILTRPISPFLIVIVKYLIGLLILLIWTFLLGKCIIFDLSKLPLPKGITSEWIILIFLIVHSMSMFSGLLAKGLERFFAVIVLTSCLSFISYQLWLKIFNLITANYYWYDIPPYQKLFISNIIPVYLTVICLLTAIVATIWLLRSRIPIWKFYLGKTILSVWLFSYILVIISESLFAPPFWPDKTVKYGDWHPSAGIVVASALDPNYEFHRVRNNESVKFQLKISQLGQKPKIIYTGFNLMKPKFSPEGKKILFSENGLIKIININTKEIQTVGPGSFGSWSHDGTKIIYAKPTNEQYFYELMMRDLKTRITTKITPNQYQLSDICWNSNEKQLYLIGFKWDIKRIDLTTNEVVEYSYDDEDKPISYYGVTPPTIILDNTTHNLIIAQIFQEELNIYQVDSKSNKISLQEQFKNFRLKTGSILLLNHDLTTFLWPRIDGTFGYQATKAYIGQEHSFGHKHGDEDHDHEHDYEEDDHEEDDA